MRGLLHFSDGEGNDEDIYVYTADAYNGELIDCNEGELRWVNKNDILNLNLWEGDRYFLKKLIDGESGFEMTLEYLNDKLVNYRHN